MSDPETTPIPVQSFVDVPASSALAGHDDMVGYQPTPMFDALAEEMNGDPRGVKVKTWEEVSYAGGRRGRVEDGADGGGAGGGTGEAGDAGDGAQAPNQCGDGAEGGR